MAKKKPGKVLAGRVLGRFKPSSHEINAVVLCPKGQFGASLQRMAEQYYLSPAFKKSLLDKRFRKTQAMDERRQWRALLARKRALSKVLVGEPRKKFYRLIEIPETKAGIKKALEDTEKQIAELINSL